MFFLHASYFVIANDTVETSLIILHLQKITKTEGFRNHHNIEQLNKTAIYIYQVFNQYSDMVSYQPYKVKDQLYKNVIATFGTEIKGELSSGHITMFGATRKELTIMQVEL